MKIVSYNIHRGYGTDRKYDLDRIAIVLEQLRADIVALQEVDTALSGPSGLHQLEYLARRIGFVAVEGPASVRQRGFYGNALLTRQPVASSKSIDLCVSGREPRLALDVVLDGPVRTRVVVVHLGLRAFERRRQVRCLLDALAEHEPGITIVLGDFNEWLPVGRPLRWIHRDLGATQDLRTFPSGFPVLALDRIWVRPAERLRHVYVHATPLARVASDHLPVVAEVACEHDP